MVVPLLRCIDVDILNSIIRPKSCRSDSPVVPSLHTFHGVSRFIAYWITFLFQHILKSCLSGQIAITANLENYCT